jgi:hypothetical protein
MTAREDYEASCGLGFKMPPPRTDVSAKDVATKIASRPALAKLIDTGALQFSEMCDLRDDIEKALRSRPDASAGLVEAAELVEEYAAECRMSTISAGVLYDFARVLRARAADRSVK